MLCISLQAQQNPQPYFRNYSTEHGLPSPEVYYVFEDSRGHMWFGTDNGIARFDGYEFKSFGAKEGLLSNVVLDIHEDGKGRIWVGTLMSKAYILEGDTLIPYRFNHLIEKFKMRSDGGSLVHLEQDETAYFGLLGYGILKIDSTGIVETIRGELPSSSLFFHLDSFKESIYVSSNNYDSPIDYVQWYEDRCNELSGYFDIVSQKPRLPKKLFMKSSSGGLGGDAQKLPSGKILLYSGSTVFCIRDSSLLWTLNDIPGTNEIIAGKDGSIWFCHNNRTGLRRYKNIEALRQQQYDEYLSGYSISNFFEDSKGGIWVTTQEKGVFYCGDFGLLNYDSRFGLPNNFVTNVAFKNENELFIGNHDGHIFQVDLSNNKIIWKDTTNLKENLQQYSLHYEDQTLYYGFSKWKDNKWHFPLAIQPITKQKQYFHYGHLTKIESLGNDKLMGVARQGISILDKKNHFVEYNSNKKISRSFAIYQDIKKRIWIGNTAGIYQFKDSVLLQPNISHPAFYHRVEDIDELPDSTIAFGTKGFGVICWKGDNILQITDEDGLTSNMLEDIHIDKNGILWAGTLNGLNKITFDSLGQPIVRTFTTFNGLPSNEINQIKSYEGQLWLCTSGGLVKFHEAEENTFSPQPIIQWAKVNGNVVNLSETNSFFYHQNDFEFRYFTINYRMNGNIPYRYRIHLNDEWQYAKSLNINYPSLPPDNYTFELQSQNEDGYWSESTTFSFVVQSPWWKTWWFRTIGIFGISFLGYRYFKYRTDQLKRESEIQNQIMNLERSALQAQMNPHFIFNSLNSIQNFILKNDRIKAVEFLSKFARLVRHNLNASIQGEISLEEEVSILDNYLALEQERFQNGFDYEIIVNELLQKQLIEFPPMLIQPYVENAVIHGLAKKEEKGKVIISFNKKNENLLVSVKDNGVGYRKDKKGEKANRHKSVGMMITQKRLELLGGEPLESVQIKSLSDEGIKGTEVSILINIKK